MLRIVNATRLVRFKKAAAANCCTTTATTATYFGIWGVCGSTTFRRTNIVAAQSLLARQRIALPRSLPRSLPQPRGLLTRPLPPRRSSSNSSSSMSVSTRRGLRTMTTSRQAASKAGGDSSPSFYARWTAPKPDYERFSAAWWGDWAVKFTVFGITGSSSMYFVRPYVPIEGSMKEGPWSYRILSLLMVTPIYTLILVTVGTIFGQQAFFLKVARRMWGRFIPSLRAPKTPPPQPPKP